MRQSRSSRILPVLVKLLLAAIVAVGILLTLDAASSQAHSRPYSISRMDTSIPPASQPLTETDGIQTPHFGTVDRKTGPTFAYTGDTIVDVAAGADDFSTLVTAVQAAGLEDTLSGEGPFTVFAPTNEAFAAVDPTVLDQLLLPSNVDALTSVLTYHVVADEIQSADIQRARPRCRRSRARTWPSSTWAVARSPSTVRTW